MDIRIRPTSNNHDPPFLLSSVSNCPKTQDLPIPAIYAYAGAIFICPVHLAFGSLLTPKHLTPSYALLVFVLAFTMSICHILDEAMSLDEYAGLHHVPFHVFTVLLEPLPPFCMLMKSSPLANHAPLDASMGNVKQKYFASSQHNSERTQYFADRKNVLMAPISITTKSDRSIHVFETLSGRS